MIVTNVTTDASGDYAVQSLPPGRYQVTVQASGFSPNTNSMTLTDGHAQTHDVELGLAGYQSSVIVAGRADSVPEANPDVSIGPFSNTPLQDLPYSISVVPQGLMENVQATTGDDVLRIDPSVVVNMPTERAGVGSYEIRGFALSNNWKSIDGISTFFINENIEDKESVQVLDGVSGFLSGLGNPGGTVNYVLKRPTASRYSSVTAGLADSGEAYFHGDFGGPIDKAGRFGYRFNVVGEDGSTGVSNQDLKRSLLSAALDWHVTHHLLLQVDGSYSTYRATGTSPQWSLGDDFGPPKAIHPDQLWGGEPWSYAYEYQNRIAGRATWDINNMFTLRVAVQTLNDRERDSFINDTINPDFTYSQLVITRNPPSENWNLGSYSFLDAKFSVGSVQNKVTVGYYGFSGKNYFESNFGFTFLPQTFNYDAAMFVPQPTQTIPVFPKTRGSGTSDQNFIIADQVRLTSYLSILAGVTRAGIVEHDYAVATGAEFASYNDSAWTPSASVIFKPTQKVMTYFTYQEGLEEGTDASPTFNGLPVTNANQQLAPGIDTQYEVGAKISLGRPLLTVDYFDLMRTATLYTPNGSTTFTASENGNENHKGVEVGLTGKITDDWMVYGGLTALKARYVNENPNTLNGTEPGGIPESYFKIYSEYGLPFVRSLTVTGGLYFQGSEITQDGSTFHYPSATWGDLGLRYERAFEGFRLTLRGVVRNVANSAYWASSGYIGQPRTVAATAQVTF